MIKLENYEVMGWEHAIRGMRNPMNSWDKSDSIFDVDYGELGPNDCELMMKLAKGGSVHAKYRRMITVYVDITAPLYWWKEFDTYKVGTVANSCSTMHKIHEKEFTIEDFSCEHLMDDDPLHFTDSWFPKEILEMTVKMLNLQRKRYLETKELSKHRMEQTTHLTYKEVPYANEIKKYWWQMIQLLPSSYNQKRTVMLNYEVLAGIYESRRIHKLDEWGDFCKWIETLPYSDIITGISCDVEEQNGTGSDCVHDCDTCDDFDCKNTPDKEN